MKKKSFGAAAVVLAVSVGIGGASLVTAEDSTPTLFHNDEVWYKDETAPALLKNGVFHVPSDFIAMFDYITVTTEREGENLLFVNEQTADYVSVLYSSQAACVNGEVWDDVSIFRENGYYYLDVDFISAKLGLSVEYSREENITDRSVRVYDEERLMAFADLLSTYTKESAETAAETAPPAETSEDVSWENPSVDEPEDGRTQIRLICKASGATNGVFARSIADRLGFTYDLFFAADASYDEFRKIGAFSSAGLAVSTAAEAEAVNERLATAFFRKTHIVLTTGDEAEDELLRQMGYEVMVPDFTVEATTDASVMFEAIVAHTRSGDSAVVYLGDVWQSETLMLYLRSLNRNLYDIGKSDRSD